MDLIETSGLAATELPIAAFRAHLRLGTGFANEAAFDAELAHYIAAAIARIEARTGKALFQRGYRLVLQDWKMPDAQPLPVAPVSTIPVITMRNRTGTARLVAPELYQLICDRHRPQIIAMRTTLPTIPSGGQVEIDFNAGFGGSWDSVPDDLAQAVFLLSAALYEGRIGEAARLPPLVEALIARWVPMRLTAGGHRG